MITRIEAYRYRCFEKLDVALGPYQVLVGKNGAGKSTLMDIPVMLGEMLYHRSIRDAFFKPTASHPERPRADAAEDLIFQHKGDWFAVAVEARIPEHICAQVQRNGTSAARQTRARSGTSAEPDTIRYELGFHLVEGAWEVSHEFLFLLPANRDLLRTEPHGLWGEWALDSNLPVVRVLSRPKGAKTEIFPERGARQPLFSYEPPGVMPALSGFPLDVHEFPATRWWHDLLFRQCVPLRLNLPALHTAQPPPGREFRVAADGSTLPWSVLQLSQDKDRFAQWLCHVQAALPHVQAIEAHKREDDDFAYVKVHYAGDFEVRSAGLSDGTLSILALSILPFLDNVPALVTVEEPETGIHPKAIEIVLESLAKLPQSQVWVATHSPVAVANTPPAALICLRQLRDGSVTATLGSHHPRLVDWQGSPSLATLFSAGVL
jgi:energy-coupling factor transporter ATP-binding protein EcfA2